jgi:hypothetical protein
MLKFKVILFIVFLCLVSGFASADLKGRSNPIGGAAFTPTGNISATTISGAVTELDTEKAPLASPTFTGTVNAAAITASGNITPTGRMLMPVGQVDFFNMTGTLTVIAASSDGASNMVAVAPATAGTFDTCFDNGGSNNGALRYTCATTKYAHIAVTVSGTPATANDIFVFGIAKNGTVGTACKALGSASGTQFSALHCVMTVAQNDVITLRVGNTTAGRDFTVRSMNIQAVLM